MSSAETDDEELRERITMFMQANFPQIKMHGGSANIQHLDADAGEVTIQLGGACSGCGISPMTIQALKTRMTKELDEINTVHADTGSGGSSGMSPSFAGKDPDGEDEDAEVPF